jgi:ABC-type uncharacterized transport system permease subunit
LHFSLRAHVTSYFLALPVGLYLTGWFVEFVRYWRGGAGAPIWSGGLLAMGWGAHSFLIAYGIWNEGVGPAAVLSAVAWVTMIVNYAVHLRWRNAVFGFVFPPLAAGLLLSTLLLGSEGIAAPDLEAHRAAWQVGLITHIASILAGNLLFAMACLFSIAYLYQEHQIKAKLIRLVVSRLPALSTLDRLNQRAIALGFFFLSAGILLGIGVSIAEAMPAREIGPRQIVPTLTWLVYAGFLLQRAFPGRRARITAIWSIAGFAVVMTSLAVELWVLTTRA